MSKPHMLQIVARDVCVGGAWFQRGDILPEELPITTAHGLIGAGLARMSVSSSGDVQATGSQAVIFTAFEFKLAS